MLRNMDRMDYAGAANLLSQRRFSSLPINNAHLKYSPVAGRPPSGEIFNGVPERYDLCRDLVQLIRIVETAIECDGLPLPDAVLACGHRTLVNNLNKELLWFSSLPEEDNISGRRLLIQQVWRLAATVCINGIHLNPHPLDIGKRTGRFVRHLFSLLDTATEWGKMIEILVLCLLNAQSMHTRDVSERHLSVLMTMSISLTLNSWRTAKLKLLYFLVQEDICGGQAQII